MRGSSQARGTLAVGVDTGGTFTDVVFRDGDRRGTYKLLSTPDDPSRAVLAALAHLFGERRPDLIAYGTTVATNAMLERRGARTALVTTAGFEDVVAIGRQARSKLYELEPAKPAPLVAARQRFGVDERVLHDGRVDHRLDRDGLERLASRLRAGGIESIAVCLLHAYANPAHERAVGRGLAKLDIPVTLSHELSPEPGEYERSSTTIVNAYVRPRVASHLAGLARDSGARAFRVMQSNGGAIGVDTACREPIRTMLSGPAGGVAAALECGRRVGVQRLITFDMGGTSTDVALIDGGVPRRAVTEIDGLPVRTACVDIHTVGAGGGSIASIDPGGSLKVGPESAGADPGPACYGRGTRPTVTDANLVLGRLRADAFLGGAMTLDEKRAGRAVAGLARRMGVTAEEAADGIVRVVEGTMERAVRVITVERGQDPRTCELMAFGGAAALHACGLARGLGIGRVLVPADAGLLSAWGVIDGPVIRDRSAALRIVGAGFDELRAATADVERAAREDVAAEGIATAHIETRSFVRMRYLGQSLEIEVPLARGLRAAFDDAHQRLFHTSDGRREVEACGVRVTATGLEASDGQPRKPTRSRSRRRPRRGAPGPDGRRGRVYLGGRWRQLPIHERAALVRGAELAGPAVITEYSSTVLVERGWRLWVDGELNLRMETTNDG